MADIGEPATSEAGGAPAPPLPASLAAQCGLVTRVLPDAEVVARAEDAARKLAAKPPAALRLTKMLMRRGVNTQVRDAIATESRAFQERLRSPEAKEAFAAFLEKRAPDYSRFS